MNKIEEIPQFKGTLQALDKLTLLTSKMKTFEDYLKEIHAQDYHGTDDDMPDAFEEWASELDDEQVEKHSNEWIVARDTKSKPK